MKALPTTYAGVTFRSRLEADWASTLDSINMAWHYEPEGFELSDGTRYAPDFYLPAFNGWLEVKGDHMDRITKVEQFAAELWAEWDAKGGVANPPLVILGMSPRALPGAYQIPHWIGVRGPGLRASISLADCPTCEQWRFVDRRVMEWEHHCPRCAASVAENSNNGYYVPWQPVDRDFAAGGRRR